MPNKKFKRKQAQVRKEKEAHKYNKARIEKFKDCKYNDAINHIDRQGNKDRIFNRIIEDYTPPLDDFSGLISRELLIHLRRLRVSPSTMEEIMKVHLICTNPVIYTSLFEGDVRLIQFRLGIKVEDLADFLRCVKYNVTTDQVCFVSCEKYKFTEQDIFYHLA